MTTGLDSTVGAGRLVFLECSGVLMNPVLAVVTTLPTPHRTSLQNGQDVGLFIFSILPLLFSKAPPEEGLYGGMRFGCP